MTGVPTASASLPGSGNVLTTSNNGVSLQIFNDPSRSTIGNPYGEAMRDVAWSPDGSVGAHIDMQGGLSVIRWDGAETYHRLFRDSVNTHLESPTWLGDGTSLVWAEKSEGVPWRIRIAPSSLSSGDAVEQLSPIGDTRHYRNPDGGPDQKVVFQRQADNGSGSPTGQSSVVLYDPAKPAEQRITLVDDNGSNPALSPDGTKVAFVRGEQILVSDLAGGNEIVVAGNAGVKDNPVWSPDGKTIAFNQGGALVATVATNGSQAAGPVTVPGATGKPAYQPRKRDRVVRLAGQTRYTTAVAVSQSHWKTVADALDTREQARSVVLSRSDTFADALAGSALAVAKRGPLLMTPPTALQADTRAEIQRVLVPGGTVYLLGSPGALSTDVANAVKALGFSVERLQGTDRFGTSVAIAKEIDPTPDLVLLATGMNFPDALAAGAAAGSYNTPGSPLSAVVVLTNDHVLPPITRSFLDTLSGTDRTLYGVGGSGWFAGSTYDPAVIEVAGETRYETARQAAFRFFGGQSHVGIATGTNWPDALAGGALMGLLDGPLMLTPGTANDLGSQAAFLLGQSGGSTREVLVFGSAAVVTDRQRSQAGYWMSGPLGAAAVTNPTDVTGR
ncbi:cell wall-binding repeat-containing protein [Micromonospora sp. NPDC126480]|uniref:cell wall-binding repeat-containing protein n=1 Tax=Micromonospora sp. NPDC126480 TaxID=3155312 RepID=UPI003328C8DB